YRAFKGIEEFDEFLNELKRMIDRESTDIGKPKKKRGAATKKKKISDSVKEKVEELLEQDKKKK
ncbi:hypothetical protein ACFLQK_02095, partial [bacterium]